MYRIEQVESSSADGRPYVLATISGGVVCTAGQIALTPNGLIEGGIEAETTQVMENLGEILTVANVGFGDVQKSTVYVAEKDKDNFGIINEIFGSYFPKAKNGKDKYGARESVPTSSLFFNAGVEISMIAKQSLRTRCSWAIRSLFNKLPDNVIRI